MVETIRGIEDESIDGVVIHPGSGLEIRQNVVPLDIGLEKVGNAPIQGHDRCKIESLSIDGEVLPFQPVQEFFARGHFEKLSQNQKLSVPSFEKFQAGITTGASTTIKTYGQVEERTLAYESILIKSDRTSERQEPPENINWFAWAENINWFAWDEAQILMNSTVVRRVTDLAGSHKQFSSLRNETKLGVPKEEGYCVVQASDLTRAELLSQSTDSNHRLTKMAADHMLAEELDLNPNQSEELLVIPECEVQESEEVFV